MRIVYVSQYFPPEMGAPAARVHELSREWVRQGHQVTVLTAFPHHPLGVKAPTDRWKLTRRETLDGIDVVRSYVWASANKGTLRRMLSYASFMYSAPVIGALRVSRPDVVIATSPQLLCGMAGYVLARWMRCPFVFEVRDLWPESILAVEAMSENVIIRGLKKTSAFLYTHCQKIVTVGEGYRRGIHERYGIPLEKIAVVPNGIDVATCIPGPKDNAIRRSLGGKDRFVILYAGTHGMAHALGNVLEVARALQEDKEKLFVFVGEGADKEALKKKAVEWNLNNVLFVDQQSRSRLLDYYAACDLGLVSLRNTPLFQEVLPSKIFEYMGMERPVLISAGGSARKLVEEAGAGEYVAPEDAPAMAAAIRRLAMRPADLEAMGLRGRQLVLRDFDRRTLAASYLKILAAQCSRESALMDTNRG